MMALVPCKNKTVKREEFSHKQNQHVVIDTLMERKNTLEEADEPGSMQAIILLAWYLCSL
jgi:hypothetical protein